MPRLADFLQGISGGYLEEEKAQRTRKQTLADTIALEEAKARIKSQHPSPMEEFILSILAQERAGLQPQPPLPPPQPTLPPGLEDQLSRPGMFAVPGPEQGVIVGENAEGELAPEGQLNRTELLRRVGISPQVFPGATSAEPLSSGFRPTSIYSKGVRFTNPDVVEQEAELRARGGARGRQQVKYQDLQKQFGFISEDVNSVFEFLDKIPPGRLGGPLAQLGAVTGQPGSENVLQYTRTKDLILSKIAKTFGGEVGVLTEGDIERISKGFPALWMNDRERAASVQWVKDYIQRRIVAYQSREDELSSKNAVPQVGQTFQGQRVRRVRQVR